MRFGTYNLEKLFSSDSPAELERQGLVCDVIRSLDVDILAIQEVHAPSAGKAAARLVEWARRVNMTAFHSEPAWDADPEQEINKIAIGVSPHDLHIGLLWRPDRVDVVPGTFRSIPTKTCTTASSRWSSASAALTGISTRSSTARPISPPSVRMARVRNRRPSAPAAQPASVIAPLMLSGHVSSLAASATAPT